MQRKEEGITFLMRRWFLEEYVRWEILLKPSLKSIPQYATLKSGIKILIINKRLGNYV